MENFSQQAEKNSRTLDKLDDAFPDDLIDWKITVAFYAALHYVNMFISHEGYDVPTTHVDLKELINPQTNEPGPKLTSGVFGAYCAMERRSRNVRYNGFNDEGFFDEHCRRNDRSFSFVQTRPFSVRFVQTVHKLCRLKPPPLLAF